MKKTILILLTIFLYVSCSTHRTIVPKFSGSVRHFKLEKPIIVSFQDSRPDTKNSQQVIESLQTGLKAIYGNNIEFKPYFDKTENNRVAIKINIKEIGSNFGIRTIQYQTYHNQITAVSSSVSTYWGSAVSTAIVSQPVVRNNVAAEGFWVGTSYLDISFIDNLHSEKKIYKFPFAAEDIRSNDFGYTSASLAAKASWTKVSSHLLTLIDNIAIQVIEH